MRASSEIGSFGYMDEIYMEEIFTLKAIKSWSRLPKRCYWSSILGRVQTLPGLDPEQTDLMRPNLKTGLDSVRAGGAACDPLEGFSLGLLRKHGATCTVTTYQPWRDAVDRSVFLLIPRVTLDHVPRSFMISEAGEANSTHAHCCSCQKMHEFMGALTDTPGCTLKYIWAHTEIVVHTVKKANAALLNSRVLILLSTLSEGTSWLAEALLCFTSRRYRVVEGKES